MSDRDAALFANESFYQAFNDRDLAAMNALWSGAVPVTCIHPGWGAIDDRDEIIASWSAILADENAPGIRCKDANAEIYGDIAVVICFEMLGEGRLIATNIFHREGEVWKMVHHQAGPTSAAPDLSMDAPSGALH